MACSQKRFSITQTQCLVKDLSRSEQKSASLRSNGNRLPPQSTWPHRGCGERGRLADKATARTHDASTQCHGSCRKYRQRRAHLNQFSLGVALCGGCKRGTEGGREVQGEDGGGLGQNRTPQQQRLALIRSRLHLRNALPDVVPVLLQCRTDIMSSRNTMLSWSSRSVNKASLVDTGFPCCLEISP